MQISADKNDVYTLQLIDISGKTITTKNYNIQQGETIVSVDCSALQPSLYFVSIVCNNQVVYSQKIIKQ